MKVNVWNTILQLSKERSVEPRIIIQAIEESLRVASARFFSQNQNVQVVFKPEKGELRVYAAKRVVEKPKNPAEEISLTEARQIRPDVKEGDSVEVDLPEKDHCRTPQPDGWRPRHGMSRLTRGGG